MRRGLSLAMAMAALLAPQAASAKDMSGRLGVGGAQTLGGVRGLDIMYWAGRLGINATTAFTIAKPDGGDTKIGFNLAAGVVYPFVQGDSAELSIGGRLNFGVMTDRSVGIALEAPLRLEWYITDHLSLHGEVGVVFVIVGHDGTSLGQAPNALANSSGVGFVVGATGVAGGGGFNVYF